MAGRTFDLVTMVQLLEHTRDPIQSLARCASLLKPGGVLWIDVPNCGSAGFADRGSVWFHTDAGRHMHFFSAESLGQAMRLVGLDSFETRYSGYARQFGWLEAEQAVWRSIYGDPRSAPPLPAPRYPTTGTLVRHLRRTMFAADAVRCDCVRVLARKQE